MPEKQQQTSSESSSSQQQQQKQPHIMRSHIFVRGSVQGVFYRKHTVQAARARGVRGYVRNLPDGRVEIVAEGRREAVESLVEWCRVGSPKSSVEGVEAAVITDSATEYTFTGFDVRH
ncbi:putative acylphosphatase [Trypanosoma theileri]|uniref:acylphosphatase n=1 Tax=Trypanosoma theileri TaxID=67003 RepID=A0A1X0NY41_9TRYP|nr:putative acylphosphatase [Trypanosoma theileri]ORC89616.1 putative acylphosphatase [Trypanosoma theileri]